MAKILGRDPVTYAKERDGFLRDLQHFHETRGTPFRRAPTINGHEIDLYLLYSLVTAQGGWIKVYLYCEVNNNFLLHCRILHEDFIQVKGKERYPFSFDSIKVESVAPVQQIMANNYVIYQDKSYKPYRRLYITKKIEFYENNIIIEVTY